jgi:hypothetical protein
VTVTRPRLAIALSVAAVAAGCGGGGGAARTSVTRSATGPARAGSATDRVRQTIHTAFVDLAHGDGARFCSLATRAGQSTLARSLPGYTCRNVISSISANLSPAQKTGLLHAVVGAVTISGVHATVSNAAITTTQGTLTGFLTASGAPTTLTRQPDGSWKIGA